MNNNIEFREGPERHALSVLWGGLAHLRARMTELEEAEAKRFKGRVGGCSAWNHPDHLLPNYFFWYATSAYSLLTLFIHAYVLKQPSPRAVRTEADKAFPELIAWRHKIGAHFAHVFPRDPKTRKDDPPATCDNSILLTVDFEIDPKNPSRGRFRISKWIFRSIYDPANPTTNNQGTTPNWAWSLTEQHDKIEAYLRKYHLRSCHPPTRRHRPATRPPRL